jgi:hypothetical protein
MNILNRYSIDELIKKFNQNPNQEDYFIISRWYEDNKNYYQDGEYIICIYLFLLGANIKNRYINFNYEQHKEYIEEIRKLIENTEPVYKMQRKIYLDYGTKSGYYK